MLLVSKWRIIVTLFNEPHDLLHRGIGECPPDFEFHFLVIIEELANTFYLEHQAKLVLILVFLTFLAVAKACNLDVIEVADALA